MIDIKDLDKAEVLAELYNSSQVQGMGFLAAKPGEMTAEEARNLIADGAYFDYLYGKVMKVNLEGDSFDGRLYDRDLGEGAAQRAVDRVRARAAVG